VPKTSQKLIRT